MRTKKEADEIWEMIALQEKRKNQYNGGPPYTMADYNRYFELAPKHQDYHSLSVKKMKEKFSEEFPEYSAQARNILMPETPNEFVNIINNDPRLIASAQEQLAARNLSLFDVCKKVTDPNAVRNMFQNTELMQAIRNEGKEQELIQAHANKPRRPHHHRTPQVEARTELKPDILGFSITIHT